ncbi:MAG: RNA methyltransferase [Candidatus Izemoplasmatales bacterium]|nr:RNA methyltransferase [Candidatus Izemoplasmatales bacterium]
MITAMTNDRIKAIMKLKQKKYRQESRSFLVEGWHLVEEALKANRCLTVVHTDHVPHFTGPTLHVTPEVFKKLSDVESIQGIMAVVSFPEERPLTQRILLLDGIQDPGNLGSLLRSARAFGFDSIVMEQTVDVYNPKVVRATQGAIFGLHFFEDSLQDFMKHHPEYTYYGTTPQGGVDLSRIEHDSENIALILGNEGSGIRDELLDATTMNLTIAIAHQESLNVAVAGGILMHLLRGKRS